MAARGHELCITARDKDRSLDLLEPYGLPYEQISVQKSGGVGLAIEMAQRTAPAAEGDAAVPSRRDDRDHGPVDRARRQDAAGPCGRVLRHRVRPPDQLVRLPAGPQRRARPTATRARSAARHVTYAGYHELAYLHPNRFPPDPDRLAAFGVAPDEPYSIVRFVSWQAVHDRRETRPDRRPEAATSSTTLEQSRPGAGLVRGAAARTTSRRSRSRDRSRTSTISWRTPSWSSASRRRCRPRPPCSACRRCSSPPPAAATPTTRNAGTGWCGTSPRTSTTSAVATVEKLLADSPRDVRAARPAAPARRTRSTSRSGWSTTSRPTFGEPS